jgi:hypothetical protein
MTTKRQKVGNKMKMMHKLVRKDSMIVSETFLIQKCKPQDSKFRKIENFGQLLFITRGKD